jgi:hypothetical protein
MGLGGCEWYLEVGFELCPFEKLNSVDITGDVFAGLITETS